MRNLRDKRVAHKARETGDIEIAASRMAAKKAIENFLSLPLSDPEVLERLRCSCRIVVLTKKIIKNWQISTKNKWFVNTYSNKDKYFISSNNYEYFIKQKLAKKQWNIITWCFDAIPCHRTKPRPNPLDCDHAENTHTPTHTHLKCLRTPPHTPADLHRHAHMIFTCNTMP